jgi:4-amino-4-deoxy-L-arabinose transferase-like glycosyltransferase
MTFLGDEGRDVLVVKRMIVDQKWTLLGPTASVGGFFLGPIYYYFMLPFLWFWKLDPTGPAVMVALFGIATIYLVFRVGKDFFGDLAGLIAASLYAVSPVVIAYSRASWNRI